MSKMNEREQLELKESRTLAQSEAVVGLLKKQGVLEDSRISDERIRAARRERTKNSYHNTLLLLKHYREISWVMECFPETIAQELEEPFDGVDLLLDQVDLELALGNQKLETRLEGVKKSRLLLDRVNEALTVLKKKPEDGERLYNLIYLTYIAPEKLTHVELLYRLDMSSRHYYRLRQQAITILSIRLWAAPAADVGLWLEMLTILEERE